MGNRAGNARSLAHYRVLDERAAHMGAESGDDSSQLERLLGLLRGGDDKARAGLISHACHRLERLTRRMLRSFPQLRRWEQTDDVLQNALLRLHRALAEVRPQSARHFYNLAALEIRRELLDLAKHHFGPAGDGTMHHTDGDGRAPDDAGGSLAERSASGEPATLEAWSHFHQQAELLPPEEREIFDLLWYQGLSQDEAAAVLGVTVRTVKRRWQRARLFLHHALEGQPPE
jgi:RNA polymerase sigma factor (sigma-70 family)